MSSRWNSAVKKGAQFWHDLIPPQLQHLIICSRKSWCFLWLHISKCLHKISISSSSTSHFSLLSLWFLIIFIVSLYPFRKKKFSFTNTCASCFYWALLVDAQCLTKFPHAPATLGGIFSIRGSKTHLSMTLAETRNSQDPDWTSVLPRGRLA